jgi:hypothetical protein
MNANFALEHINGATRKVLQDDVEVDLLHHLHVASGPVAGKIL